ncbi:small integral membrane protein 5 isoform X2 [Anolis carolinensis]|uniref:small integral membrane protein 5 isoform X2 n=1 Tax=Anolis carolinensis TaxID=28377 RepID=UPI002F2B33F2
MKTLETAKPPVLQHFRVFSCCQDRWIKVYSVAKRGLIQTMSYKDFQNELYAIGNKLWLKLQRLPKAEPVEIVCFSVIILFIGFSRSLTQ